MLKKLLFAMTGLATLSASAFTSAHAYSPHDVDMYVVMFRADWCGPCKIVEPALDQALQTLNDPRIDYVTIDITDPARSEIGAHQAFDREIVPQYNAWMGVTGFAAIIDADTKQTLGCVNMVYDAGSMAMHIRNLKTYAVSNQHVQDMTCPEPNYR